MKVGTVETIEEKEKKRRTRGGLTSGFGSNGGNRNGGGGGGNDGGDNNNPQKDSFEEAETYQSNKYRIAMWFLLLAVMMTFGGLIGAYIVLSTNGEAEWKPFNLPVQVWVSTILLLTSSLTLTISQNALNADNQKKAKNWLLATTVLGGTFIASQILSWLELARQGVYVESNPYAGFFYIFTGVHALHVLAGISALGYIVLRTWQETFVEEELKRRKTVSNAVGWFWHCMDGLWVVLFLLLGFWK
jgi:cytochrome c oxidase subunit 3